MKKNILEWADNKNLLKEENKFIQLAKLLEESGELAKAIIKDDRVEQIDAIGDCVIVLTILAEQLKLDIDWCTEKAFSVIKNRTGKTINGSFIKSEDL
jgi:NTP pyrophosphatase (non-canonical NTP hydrolase)